MGPTAAGEDATTTPAEGSPVGWQGIPDGEHLPGGSPLGWPGDMPADGAGGDD